MYFQILHRSNSQNGECDRYCCLKESFRDAAGTTHNLIGYRPTPFRKPKSVLHKCTNDKTQKITHQIVSG